MSEWFDAEAHADRALEMYERGRWAEAEAELRKALSLHPDQAEWHFNLGLTLEASGRDADALLSYQQALELMPQEAEPLVAASRVAMRLRQYRQAIEWADHAIGIDSQAESAYALKIEALSCQGLHDEAETAFYLAQHALDEPSAQCLALMAESLILRELYGRAEWCLREALRTEPAMPRLKARLAAVSALLGKSQRAVQLFLSELRDDPGNIDTLLDFGELLMQLGRLPEAGEKFRRVLELEPANVDAHYALGRIALAGRQLEQATIEFELVLKLDPQFPAIRTALAEALLQRGRADQGRELLVQEFDLLKSQAAEQASALKNQLMLLPPAIMEDGQPVSEDRPGTAASRYLHYIARMADLLLSADEPSRAAELLELALAEAPSADVLRQLAVARFRAGDLAGGTAASRRVLRMEPGCIRSIHNLALAALQQNQPRLAAGWVKRGMSVSPQDEGIRRLRVRVWLARAGQACSWLADQARLLIELARFELNAVLQSTRRS